MVDADGSEDVNDFLQRIRELGDKRDKEDEERNRKLEEEIIQGRKERQARRAERARSLSPTKDSPSNIGAPSSPHSLMDTPTQLKINPVSINSLQPSLSQARERLDTRDETPSKSRDREVVGAAQDFPQPLSKSLSSSPSAAMPSRAGTLSWQQRPTSKGTTTTRSRPLSMVATENNALKSPRATPDPTSTNDNQVSRSQIGQSPGAKDHSWFSQTADRGLGSTAYRKNHEDNMTDTPSMTGSMRSPGLSRESTMELETGMSPPRESMRSLSPSREGSVRGKIPWSQKHSSTTSLSSANGISSPIPTLSSQRLEPPSSDTTSPQIDELAFGRALAMSPSQGRISPERGDRPPSPTKGLGGFVQSAMLKRSDSVNKRWSAQAVPGLSRGNSIASNRSGYDVSRTLMSSMSPPREMKASSISREASPLPNSRPGSSHSTAIVTHNPLGTANQISSSSTIGGKEQSPVESGFIKPALPDHARTKSEAGTYGATPSLDKSPPVSPSKTMDPKRWSPTKASWLESAINKPDSPKPKAPPPQQPSWMADISKAKQQRESVDLGKGSKFQEITTSGLIRSPPMGASANSPNFGGVPVALNPAVVRKAKIEAVDNLAKTKSLPLFPKPEITLQQSPKAVTPVASAESSESRPIQNNGISPTSESVSSVGPSHAHSPSTGRSQKSLTVPKMKPTTPPKKDFRSTLKPRQAPEGKENKEEPEFKNVFGKLKRTHTQNYVAPDELKDNILRGKAGLAITAGPKKTERKDELKESILKQKEAMKVGSPTGVTRKTSGGITTKHLDPSTPEAISKRDGLTKSESLMTTHGVEGENRSETLEAIARQKTSKENSKPIQPNAPPSGPKSLSKEPILNGKLADRFNPALVGLLSRGPSPITGGSGPPGRTKSSVGISNDEGPSASVDRNENAENGSQLTHMTKARARGPKRRLPTTSKQDITSSISSSKADPSTLPESPDIGTIVNLVNDSPALVEPIESTESRPLANITHNSNKVSYPVSALKPITPSKNHGLHTTKSLSPEPQVSSKSASPTQARASPILKQKPPLSPKTRGLRTPSASTARPLPTTPIHSTQDVAREKDLSSAPKQSLSQRENDINEDSVVSVRGAAARWGALPTHGSDQIQPSKPVIKLPSRADEVNAMEQAGLVYGKGQDPIGLGIHTVADEHRILPSFGRSLPSPPLKSPKSPPTLPKKPDSIASRVVSNGTLAKPAPQVTESPIPKTSEALRLFADFFDEAPTSNSKVDIDTHTALTSRLPSSDSGKIKTLRKQIWEVAGNGKKVPVPSDQEHILFEDNMYLCTHVFGSSTGTRTTEVYLWCGDGVSASAFDDAQLFSKKHAKENSSKLTILKQGKETSNFFQALGGIVITRRGSSSQAESSSSASATYMLCGRLHVGQIAFDEVDFSISSLCTGFPFIVSARFGKLYLWKGKGSTADELGCARLIGMDLGLTGEIEEVDEGKEPHAFWESFPGGQNTLPTTSKHWHLKASCEKYATRLFTVEHEIRPKSSSSSFMWGRRSSSTLSSDDTITANIKEIAPFAQTDITKDGIFVLDAFFEIYIILGHSTTSKFHTFRTALLFAQEYAILAASLEDRPFIPIGTVVLEGTPRGMKTAFRKWDNGKACTRHRTTIRRSEAGDEEGQEQEATVVPLSAALEATGGQGGR